MTFERLAKELDLIIKEWAGEQYIELLGGKILLFESGDVVVDTSNIEYEPENLEVVKFNKGV